jgi:hypothetical protein
MKITSFLGKFPKRSAELLPDTAAQTANNFKLYSGDLIPYPEPVATGDTVRTGGVKTLYAMRDPDTLEPVFLSWANAVNVATPTVILDTDQRIYYTGDGAPKVATYDLATAGAGPFPTAYFLLGLPLPETKVTLSAASVPSATVSTIARAANQMTVVTSAPHGITNNSIISLSGASNLSGSYSQTTTTVTCTVTAHGLSTGDSVTCIFTQTSGTGEFPASGTYQITGVTTNTFTVTVGNSDSDVGVVQVLMGSLNANNVTVTVVNSTTLTFPNTGFSLSAKAFTGAKVTLSSTPVARTYIYTWVSDWNNEESIGSEPSTEVVVREGQVVTVSAIPVAPPSGNYNIRGVRLYRTVTGLNESEYVRLKTLWFPALIENLQRTSNVVTVTCSMRHKLAKDDRVKLLGITSDASFNGEGFTVTSIVNDYTFTFAQTAADTNLLSEADGKLYYDVSQRDTDTAVYMTGSTFTDNFDGRLLFSAYQSENYAPPPAELKGLVAINDGMMAGFVGNVVYISEPGKPHAWPSVSAKTLEHNIVALAAVYGSLFVATEKYPYVLTGNTPESMSVTRVDAVLPCVSARSLVSMNYGAVFATNEGLAVFSPTSGAQLTTQNIFESDTWNEALDPTTIVAGYYRDQYFASHAGGAFTYAFDAQTGGQLITCDDVFTASYFDALHNRLYLTKGTDGVIYEWDDTTQPKQVAQWKSKVMVSKEYANFGAARIMADFTSGKTVTFKLYADKSLVFTTTVADNKPFRLPSGYRSDTYEVEVLSDIRVRSIHMAETVLGLKEV